MRDTQLSRLRRVRISEGLAPTNGADVGRLDAHRPPSVGLRVHWRRSPIDLTFRLLDTGGEPPEEQAQRLSPAVRPHGVAPNSRAVSGPRPLPEAGVPGGTAAGAVPDSSVFDPGNGSVSPGGLQTRLSTGPVAARLEEGTRRSNSAVGGRQFRPRRRTTAALANTSGPNRRVSSRTVTDSVAAATPRNSARSALHHETAPAHRDLLRATASGHVGAPVSGAPSFRRRTAQYGPTDESTGVPWELAAQSPTPSRGSYRPDRRSTPGPIATPRRASPTAPLSLHTVCRQSQPIPFLPSPVALSNGHPSLGPQSRHAPQGRPGATPRRTRFAGLRRSGVQRPGEHLRLSDTAGSRTDETDPNRSVATVHPSLALPESRVREVVDPYRSPWSARRRSATAQSTRRSRAPPRGSDAVLRTVDSSPPPNRVGRSSSPPSSRARKLSTPAARSEKPHLLGVVAADSPFRSVRLRTPSVGDRGVPAGTASVPELQLAEPDGRVPAASDWPDKPSWGVQKTPERRPLLETVDGQPVTVHDRLPAIPIRGSLSLDPEMAGRPWVSTRDRSAVSPPNVLSRSVRGRISVSGVARPSTEFRTERLTRAAGPSAGLSDSAPAVTNPAYIRASGSQLHHKETSLHTMRVSTTHSDDRSTHSLQATTAPDLAYRTPGPPTPPESKPASSARGSPPTATHSDTAEPAAATASSRSPAGGGSDTLSAGGTVQDSQPPLNGDSATGAPGSGEAGRPRNSSGATRPSDGRSPSPGNRSARGSSPGVQRPAHSDGVAAAGRTHSAGAASSPLGTVAGRSRASTDVLAALEGQKFPADLDRLVDELHRRLERKRQIEREQEGVR